MMKTNTEKRWLVAASTIVSLFASLPHANSATIDPVNNEKLAIVKITTTQPQLFPVGRLPVVQLYSTRLVSPMTFQIGQPQRILPAAGTTFDLQFNNGNPYRISTKVDLVAGKTFDFVIPQMLVQWSADDFAVELGPIPRFDVTRVGETKPFYSARLNQAFELYHKSGLPLVPGDFSIMQWPPEDLAKPTLVNLQWNTAPKVPLWADAMPKRSTLNLRMTKAVSFPDAKYASGCNGSSIWATIGSSGYSGAEFVPGYELPIHLAADIHQVRYYRKVYGTTHPLRVNFGNIQKTLDILPGATVEDFIERLEVNKVKVVREDGSQYMAEASYTVEYLNHDGQWLQYSHYPKACLGYGNATFAAPSGIYLPKGSYRVTISYKTDEGPKTQVHTIAL